MFAILAGVSMVANVALPGLAQAATPDTELGQAYEWARSKEITTMDSYEAANMYGAVTRAQLAKMLSNWAMNVRGLTPDESLACEFTDVASVQGDLKGFIKTSCQLGLMGQGITAFRPYDKISRAEFGTALSRALWGNENNGEIPYYAKHLNALKAAGIMTQIDNPENRDEIRGYVMLMLMRAEANEVDCTDADIMLVCLDPELDAYKECPAACREDAKDSQDWEKVAKGDLEVTADAAPNKKIIASGTSDLDTITFKTSEKVDINKITLERYGYSKADQVVEVRLEDQDGNVIADAKSLTKDKVTLSLKKGYRTVDGKLEATLVVTTSGADGTMGFKVTDVDSTAANVDLDDYSANLYDVVGYSSEVVYVQIKGTAKDYNYEEGKSYEVARLKVKAGNSAINVKGFTLTNASGLDVGEFLDELTVTSEGKDVKGLKYSVNKDDELVISFDEVKIDINKNATFVISASFKEFDDYGETIAYYIAEPADVNAVEVKNGSRVQLNLNAAWKADAKAHKFAGGKIKIVNKKLGNVDAAQGAEDIVVAEWNITVSEGISKMKFDITVNNTGVESLKFVINGDEYEGKPDNKNAPTKFSFTNVEIEKSGKAQFLVGIFDKDDVKGSVSFSAFNKNAFNGAKYSDANEPVQTADVAGSISFSKVTIQASKWALENNISKEVEFITNSTTRKTVFDGTYTAKKGDVNLNSFYIDEWTVTGTPWDNEVTFYVSIDGEEVGDTNAYGSGNKENFSDVLVEAGKSVKVKVEAEVEAYNSWVVYDNFTLVLAGEDKNGNDAGEASDTLVKFKTKESGSVKVETTTSKNTVLLKAKNQNIAEFTVKPSNSSDDDLTLDSLEISFSGVSLTADDIRVKVDGTEYDATSGFTYEPNENIPTAGLKVQVILKKELTGAVEMSLVSVNNKSQTRTFSKRYEEALVYVTSQENKGDETKYILGVETSDSDITVSNVKFYASGTVVASTSKEVSNGDDSLSVLGDASWAKYIDKIEYDVEDGDGNKTTVTIEKSEYQDYFKVWSDYIKVFKAKD